MAPTERDLVDFLKALDYSEEELDALDHESLFDLAHVEIGEVLKP